MLPQKTKDALRRYQEFEKLQGNSKVKGCRVPDCPGVYEMTQPQCTTCGREHCRKCWEILHEGDCK